MTARRPNSTWWDRPCEGPALEVGGYVFVCGRPVSVNGPLHRTHEEHTAEMVIRAPGRPAMEVHLSWRVVQ